MRRDLFNPSLGSFFSIYLKNFVYLHFHTPSAVGTQPFDC